MRWLGYAAVFWIVVQLTRNSVRANRRRMLGGPGRGIDPQLRSEPQRVLRRRAIRTGQYERLWPTSGRSPDRTDREGVYSFAARFSLGHEADQSFQESFSARRSPGNGSDQRQGHPR